MEKEEEITERQASTFMKWAAADGSPKGKLLYA
jgi:hypothetical protein